MKLVKDCYLVANEHSSVQYMCESREQAEYVAIMLEQKTRWFWFVRRSWHSEESISAVLKSINRHQWKEVKRMVAAYKRENQQVAALIDEINQYLAHCKAMEWRDNLVSGYDFRANQSTVKDMTSEETKEWAGKFFSAL